MVKAVKMVPVDQWSGGMFDLMLDVAGHSFKRCHGVCSSMKHFWQIGSSLPMIEACLARKQ